MYHFIVRQIMRGVFRNLSKGNYDALLRQCRPDVYHVFPGKHPLGGERHSTAALRQWFGRLERLLPGLQFKVKRVAASGWPWDTVAMIEWSDHTTLQGNYPYRLDGSHMIRLRWGKAVEIHPYLDPEPLERACAYLASRGVAEATAAPLTDADVQAAPIQPVSRTALQQ